MPARARSHNRRIDDGMTLVATEMTPAAPASMALAANGWSTAFLFDKVGNARMISDPRFVGLCAKIGLCDYWVETGHWPDCADTVGYDFRAEARRLVAESRSVASETH